MKLDIVAGSQNDEWYTPKYAVVPLLKYIKPKSKIWCPFDKMSEYVKVFRAEGHTVINTHIDSGEDFFRVERECDYIISNPPWSKKTECIKRCFELGRPFALLVGVVGLFESLVRFDIFSQNEFEIMYFNKRISYDRGGGDGIIANPPFSSVYICHKLLPKQIVFETIDKKGV